MKRLSILIIILIFTLIPYSFAEDIENNTLTDDGDYKYISKPLNTSVDYIKGESCLVDVSAEYESEDLWSSLDLRDSSMYVYIDENDTGIEISKIPSESKSFTVNLKDINYTFEDNKNYSLCFHPPKGLLEYNNLNLESDCKFYALQVNVISLDSYDYSTYVTPSNTVYTRGESKNISVLNHINSAFNVDDINMCVVINDEIMIKLDNIKANSIHFDFDLALISDKLKDGRNNVIFKPDLGDIDNYYFNPLVVDTIFGDIVYVSTQGDDKNSGDKISPVKSISKAIEICKETGIENIYILEGKYFEDSISIDISLNIHGLGDVVIDAENNGRIFKITGENIVTLSNMTLINGYAPTDGISWDIHEVVYYAAGGAIYIESVYVTIENMTFINNTAEEFGGAINVEAPYFKLINSTFINNEAGVYGGAIDIEDINATVLDCKFITNTASNGGAIGWIGANALLANSYFERNIATDIGGALFIENTQDSDGNLVENCTFIFNEAPQQGGAIEVENEDMLTAEYTVIRYCQFINNTAYNGGGISAYYGDVASLNNIFINNTAGYGAAIAGIGVKSYANFVGTLYLRNNTIFNCKAAENGDAIFNMGVIESWLNITFNNQTNINIDDGKAVDLSVSIFDDMGNPISGSPLNFTVGGKQTINPSTDLVNGYAKVHYIPRENGTFVVSGIYGTERYMLDVYTVNTVNITINNAIADYFGIIYVSQEFGDDDNTGSIDNPVKSFQQGYILATRNGASFSMVVYNGTYTVSKCILYQSFNVTGIGNPIFDGKNNGTMFSLYGFEKDEFHFTGINFINGVANPSTYAGMNDGGAIFFKGGNLYLKNDTFTTCSANDYGGAVYINKGLDMNSGRMYTAYAYITNCTFKNNLAKYYGGAIAIYESDVIINNSIFTSNTAKKGGAISILEGMANLTIINSTFSNNQATDSGGALDINALNTYNTRYYAKIINSTFISNNAVIAGAIMASDSDITDSVFINNTASNCGGALIFTDTESTLTYSSFINNNATKGKSYYGNSTSIDDNYWGVNVTSPDELVTSNIININDTNKTPRTWSRNGEFTKQTYYKTFLKTDSKTFKVNDVKTITATLTDEDGKGLINKKIIFTIDTKHYTVYTNSKGIASVKITLTQAKSYDVVVSFNADGNYLKSSINSKIKVVKEKTKISISKNLKNKKITVTLKSQSGKLLKSKKIILKIKSKKYIVKTNKKGKAVIKIKILKKKSYKAKITFNGDSGFIKSTKTIKFKT